MRPQYRAVAWIGGAVLLVAGFALGGTPFNLQDTAYWQSFAWMSARLDNPVLLAHRVGAIAVVAAAVVWPPLHQVLTWAPIRFLGRVSFMVYLLHILLICSLFSWLLMGLTPIAGYNLATLLAMVIFLVVLLALATLATRLIDEPAIRLSRRMGTLTAKTLTMLRASAWLSEKRAG